MTNYLPESLPSLCEWCGVPESISPTGPVSERYDLLQRWTVLCHLDFDSLPCVLRLPPAIREQLYAYIWENILRLVTWDVCTFETFRSDLLETVELSAAWATLQPHIWLDYAKETTSVFAKEPRVLSDEEIQEVEEVTREIC